MNSNNAFFIFGMALLSTTGCGALKESSWHQKCEWNAENYFDDPQVIALCNAIEANDLQEIDRLVAAGADVNATGSGNMTPLLWAFPDNSLPRFKRLLEHGANPNVIIQDGFNTRGRINPGESVTHLACITSFPGYFDAVFKHKGNPNLVCTSVLAKGDTPLFAVIAFGGVDKEQKIQLLLNLGADLKYSNDGGQTAVVRAVSWGGQYSVALMLLRAGADFGVYEPQTNSRLIHLVIAEERRSKVWTPQQREDHRSLLNYLVEKGESVEEARADLKRWSSWSSKEYKGKMDAEVAKRLAHEKAADIEQNGDAAPQ